MVVAQKPGQTEESKTPGREEFFRRMMGSEEAIKRIHEKKGRFIFLNKEIVSKLQLNEGTSCKWEEVGNFLVMTPLKEKSVPKKVMCYPSTNSFKVAIPDDMLPGHPLKAGDRMRWEIEGENVLSLKKMKGKFHRKMRDGWFDVTKTEFYGSGSKKLRITIPQAIAKREWAYGIWSLSRNGDKLLLELMDKDPCITGVIEEEKQTRPNRFSVHMPPEIGKSFGVGDSVTLKLDDGKLYIRKGIAKPSTRLDGSESKG